MEKSKGTGKFWFKLDIIANSKLKIIQTQLLYNK